MGQGAGVPDTLGLPPQAMAQTHRRTLEQPWMHAKAAEQINSKKNLMFSLKTLGQA